MQTMKFFEMGAASELTQGAPGEFLEDYQQPLPQPQLN